MIHVWWKINLLRKYEVICKKKQLLTDGKLQENKSRWQK